MKGWLPVVGAAAGFACGWVLFGTVRLPSQLAGVVGPYLSIATLAALDTVLGGVRAGMEGRFQDDVFVSGFILNTLLAAGLALLGDWIGVDLFLAAVVALGTRVFLNLSLIRRYYLNKLALEKHKDTQAIISP